MKYLLKLKKENYEENYSMSQLILKFGLLIKKIKKKRKLCLFRARLISE